MDSFKQVIAISQNTSYKKGQPIRLLSCSTGQPRKYDDCFAQKLANELNAPVKAPTDTLFIDRKGNYTIGKNNTGQWIDFLPHYSVTNSFDANWRIAERMNRR